MNTTDRRRPDRARVRPAVRIEVEQAADGYRATAYDAVGFVCAATGFTRAGAVAACQQRARAAVDLGAGVEFVAGGPARAV